MPSDLRSVWRQPGRPVPVRPADGALVAGIAALAVVEALVRDDDVDDDRRRRVEEPLAVRVRLTGRELGQSRGVGEHRYQGQRDEPDRDPPLPPAGSGGTAYGRCRRGVDGLFGPGSILASPAPRPGRSTGQNRLGRSSIGPTGWAARLRIERRCVSARHDAFSAEGAVLPGPDPVEATERGAEGVRVRVSDLASH